MPTKAELDAKFSKLYGGEPAKKTRAELDAEFSQLYSGSEDVPALDVAMPEMSAEELDARAKNPSGVVTPTPVLNQMVEQYPNDQRAINLRKYRDITAGKSIPDRIEIGVNDAMSSIGRGINQRVNESKLDILRKLGFPTDQTQQDINHLNEDELQARDQYGPNRDTIAGSVGGAIPGVAASVAAYNSGLPVLAPTMGRATAAEKALQYGKVFGGEAAIGGAAGYVQPTLPGESPGRNALLSAALNTAIPAAGVLARSNPVQKVVSKVDDLIPWHYGPNIKRRNEAAKEAVRLENEPIIAGNERNKAEYASSEAANKQAFEDEQRVLRQSQEQAKRDAEDKAAEATRLGQEDADMGAMQKNTVRYAVENGVRKQLVDSAGWPGIPKNNIEAKDFSEAVGKEYGALIDHLPFDANDIAGMANSIVAKGHGMAESEINFFRGLATRIDSAAADSPNGILTGDFYKKLRADISGELNKGASSEYRRRLIDAKEQLDKSFYAGKDPDLVNKVEAKRAQVSNGMVLNKIDHPYDGSGFDVDAAIRGLEKKRNNKGLITDIYGKARDIPEPAVPEKVKVEPEYPTQDPTKRPAEYMPGPKPEEAPLVPPPTLESTGNYVAPGIFASLMTGGAAGVGAASGGLVPGAAAMLGAIGTHYALKHSKNPMVRALLSLPLKGYNISERHLKGQPEKDYVLPRPDDEDKKEKK